MALALIVNPLASTILALLHRSFVALAHVAMVHLAALTRMLGKNRAATEAPLPASSSPRPICAPNISGVARMF
jgi:hypothetical protein